MDDFREKPYLTPSEVAEFLMVAPVTVRAWAHKGLIAAQTTPGGHRRFLRVDIERFASERQLLASPKRRSGPTRILIVDDNDLLVRFLTEMLGLHGAQTASAADGFEAGVKLHRFNPDIVLLDLMMPGLDGFAVCRQVKGEAETRATRVIAMTGFHTPEHVERIVAAGAECCLPKPLDEANLLEILGLSLPAAVAAVGK